MRVYLDLCCLKRPFDSQAHPVVRLETEAVLALLGAPADRVTLIRSAVHALLKVRSPWKSRFFPRDAPSRNTSGPLLEQRARVSWRERGKPARAGTDREASGGGGSRYIAAKCRDAGVTSSDIVATSRDGVTQSADIAGPSPYISPTEADGATW